MLVLAAIFMGFWFSNAYDLRWHVDDHHVINTAGRQRLYAERVYSAALRLEASALEGSADAIRFQQQNLRDTFSSFAETHAVSRSNLIKMLEPADRGAQLIEEQDQRVNELRRHVSELAQANPSDMSMVHLLVERIQDTKESYRQIIDTQVDLIANSATTRLNRLQSEQTVFLGSAALVLLAGLFLLFQPMAKKAVEAADRIARQNQELEAKLKYERLVAGLARPYVDHDPDRFISDTNSALLAMAKFAGSSAAGMMRLDDSEQRIESITIVRVDPQATIHRAIDLAASELPQLATIRNESGWKLVPGTKQLMAQLAGIDEGSVVSNYFSIAKLEAGGRFLGILGLGWAERPDETILSDEPLRTAITLFAGALAHQRLEESTRLVHRRIGLRPEHLVKLNRTELLAFLERTNRVETIGSVAGGIAHDFNNVLSAIRLAADNAKLGSGDPLSLASNLERIKVAAERGKELVARILDFAKPPEHEPSVSDFAHEVANAIDLVKGSLPPGVRLDLHASEEGLIVAATPTLIHQIVLNLITNAANAIQMGEGRIAVDVHRSDRSDRALLTVSDTGIGMAADVQERVFEPFFSTRKRNGTGLGLAVVHAAVTEAGGSVEVQSKPGVGTTFSISLPIAGAAATDSDPTTNGDRSA
ncbi:MAG: Adaptive-response sensory-kinase SasA [Fimbriimonadaceae bacterium]|nr:Adaptive-response sensory-kinase SasA [Fimbriimonadaceae bacterium]